MALVEGCKHAVEITVPIEEVERETDRVVADLTQKVRLPGFRPGKAPGTLIRKRYEGSIRQEVLESLVPKHFRRHVEQENLRIVGTPDIKDVHFEQGEPLRFKAEFETAPDIELQEYLNLSVSYREPEVSAEAIAARLEELRLQKADFVNVDPRPLADGDFAVVSLTSLSGVEEPIRQDELVLHIGDEQTLAAFSENLRGASPGEEKEFDVTYPEEFGQERLAGKTVRFLAKVTAIRQRELPEINDEFAADLGDYQNLGELEEAIRKSLYHEREHQAQDEAKNEIIDKLVDSHDFPIPQAYVERQIELNVEQRLRAMAAQGVDLRSVQLDWEKIRGSQTERAMRDVRASLLLDKIAERESIEATVEEVDHEVQRAARQAREPVAALRMRWEKDGTFQRIASRIRTGKTLSFLFERARKVAPSETTDS